MGRSQLYREPGRGKSMCKGPVAGQFQGRDQCGGAEQREEKTQRWLEADLSAMRVTVGEFRFYFNCSGRAWGALNRGVVQKDLERVRRQAGSRRCLWPGGKKYYFTQASIQHHTLPIGVLKFLS